MNKVTKTFRMVLTEKELSLIVRCLTNLIHTRFVDSVSAKAAKKLVHKIAKEVGK